MSKNQLWFGYLEAGAKSTAVALDQKLDTGDANTVYLFNLARNEILEYRREIVEPKLRKIGTAESDLLQRLKEAYRKARRSFTPPGGRAAVTPDTPPRRSRDPGDAAKALTSAMQTEQDNDDADVGTPWDDDDD